MHLIFLLPINYLIFYFPVVDLSFPDYAILKSPYIFCSVIESECSLTMIFSILEFSDILISIGGNHKTKTIWNSILYITFINWASFFFSKSLPFQIRVFTPFIKILTFVINSNHKCFLIFITGS